MSDTLPKRFPFPGREDLEASGYNVFPPDLESDETIFFHATAAENVENILQEGLLPGSELEGQLTTISYAENSVIALTHWIYVRNGRDGLILALRFKSRNELFLQNGTYYSKKLKEQPAVVGTCEVLSTYQHI